MTVFLPRGCAQAALQMTPKEEGRRPAAQTVSNPAIDRPQWQIAIDLHQFGDTKPISGCDVFGDQIARGEVTQEPDFSVVAEPSPE
jgi:hypothetical protein